MPELSNPHDKLFKATFGRPEVAADWLMHYLPPEVAAELDLRAPQLQKDSFIDPALREHFSDLLYRVPFKADSGRGQEVFVYTLFEHKSAPEWLVAYQVLRYEVMAWEPLARAAKRRGGKLPPILPIVIYHGRRRWNVPLNFGGLIEWGGAEALRRYVPEFHYLLLDLATLSDAQIVGTAVARVTLSIGKNGSNNRLP